MIKVEYLTPALYEKFDGAKPTVTVKGLALTEDDEVLGILCQAIIEDQHFITCGLKENVNKRKIIEGWRQFVEQLSDNINYFALCSDDIPTAPGFLKHFGFEPYMNNIWIYRG